MPSLAMDGAAVATPATGGTRSSTSASSGTKRKRESGPKFYAVRVGYKPGIYHNWQDCLKQVTGYKNASFKSFTSLTEADNFIKNISPSVSGKPQKFYAVRSGKVPGVYTDWASAQAQITGWKQPKHRSFTTKAEAEAFVNETAISPTEETAQDGAEAPMAALKGQLEQAAAAATAPPAKKAKSNGFKPVNGASEDLPEPGTGDLPPDAEDGFDHRLTLGDDGQIEYKSEERLSAKKLMPSSTAPKKELIIYTDGSTLGNGKGAEAIAGVGVWFGDGDDRNISEPLPGDRQTNQRAELTAIKRALEMTPYNRDVLIYSDSSYSIKCVTEWINKWRQNNWLNASRKPVENRDLIELVVNKIEERLSCGVKTRFEHIKGHADSHGNQQADRLAVDGAREAKASRDGDY